MMLRNRVSRWHIVDAALKGAAVGSERIGVNMHELRANNLHDLRKTQELIIQTGKDPEGA